MTCENYSSNNIPLGVGYDTNGNAKSFVELSAITVATVSATTYIGAAVEGTFSSLTDVCYSPTATVQGQILIWNATGACWAASTPVVGGGGSLPTGNVGDILVVPPDGGAFAATTPTSFITDNKIITTADGTLNAYAQATSLNSYVPRTGSTTVTGPVSFVTNPVTFNGGVSKFSTGFEATGPATIEGNAIATEQYVQDNAARLGVANTFTQVNTFQAGLNVTGPLVFTGTATFTERPKMSDDVNFAIATDLNSYVPTGTFYSTTATLLEKPSTGSDGEILLYSTGNNTAATGVAAFITDQNIVKTSDLGSYVTEAEYDASASLFVATSITTANSRTFLGTTTDLDTLNNVITLDDGLAEGDVLTYQTGGGGKWYNAPVAAKTLTFGNKSVTPGTSGAYTVSNAVTVPPGNSGKGDSTANSFIFFSGTDASSTEFVGTRWGANWVEGPQNIETTNGNYFAYVSATPTGDAPGSSGVAAVALNANALEFIENGSATTATFASLTVNGTAPSSTIAPTLSGHLATKSYVDSAAGMPSSIATANTVDNDGSIATSLGVQRLPHVHGQFIWTRFKTAGTQSSAGNLTTLGNGITTASDIEIVKSIPDGASAGDNTLMSYTIATGDGGTARWNVGDSQGIYKITLNAIMYNSTSNPDTDINIKVNGTAVGGATDLFKTAGSWIAHQSRPASFEWVGLIRSSWDITIDATSAVGNTNFLAGTTVTITRIA